MQSDIKIGDVVHFDESQGSQPGFDWVGFGTVRDLFEDGVSMEDVTILKGIGIDGPHKSYRYNVFFEEITMVQGGGGNGL